MMPKPQHSYDEHKERSIYYTFTECLYRIKNKFQRWFHRASDEKSVFFVAPKILKSSTLDSVETLDVPKLQFFSLSEVMNPDSWYKQWYLSGTKTSYGQLYSPKRDHV